jgi:hypothetical protein
MTDRLTTAAPVSEPDVHWPPDALDREHETCWCLPHGKDLPCGRCQTMPSTVTRKESQ